jgi:polyhydroxybutyrate depolymerase
VYVPPGHDAAKPAPLVLAFHGGEGSAATAERGLMFNPIADRDGIIMVYPQGTAQGAKGFHWNDGRVSPRFPGAEKVDDVGFIRVLIGKLREDYRIDPLRIYATGNSNGGFFTQRLGWELSDILAAIGPSAGTLGVEFEKSFAPKHPVHVIHLHGTRDPAVPFEGGMVIGQGGLCLSAPRMVDLWVKANGCITPPKVETLPKKTDNAAMKVHREAYAPGTKGAEVVFYVLEGHGHNWAGRTSTNPRAGPSTLELNAAQVIWDFFSKHPKVPARDSQAKD